MSARPWLLAIYGPTASGKSDLAELIADVTGAGLINADAFQVYRGMDIGTGKSSRAAEYALIDHLNPDETYGVGQFVADARAALAEDQSAIVVGGTGLYLRALTEGYDAMAAPPDPELRALLNRTPLSDLVESLQREAPAVAAQIDLRNPARVRRALERARQPRAATFITIPHRIVKVALVPDVESTGLRIERRVNAMLQNGWIEEIERLAHAGYGPGDPGFRAIGYEVMSAYRDGQVTRDEAVLATVVQTRQYAKRQRTWLRSEPNLHTLDLARELVSQVMPLISRE
ncbi:MAG: tRNA (adenosine(37)-N6)-dimethylallyltransferase MiaA [Fimbriimonadaceae bacterium]|nr:tRNA (adenosine(37)-N6)-dimethylallyltransferase MiaA [Fimbriimonadaceae bacterium]